MAAAAVPTVLWAQRKQSLFITIDVQDAENQKVEVVDDADKKTSVLKFTADAHSGGVAQDAAKKNFVLDLPLFASVDFEASKVSVTSRQVYLVLEKADPDARWPRLTQEKGRHLSHIRCDWDRWVDSDDEDALPEGGDDGGAGGFGGGMDFSSLGGMGGGGMGGGGMGGMGGLEGLLGGMGGGGMGGMGGGGMANLASMMGGMGGGMGGGGMGGGMMGGMGGGAGGLPDFGAGGLEGDDEGDDEDDMPPLEEEEGAPEEGGDKEDK